VPPSSHAILRALAGSVHYKHQVLRMTQCMESTADRKWQSLCQYAYNATAIGYSPCCMITSPACRCIGNMASNMSLQNKNQTTLTGRPLPKKMHTRWQDTTWWIF